MIVQTVLRGDYMSGKQTDNGKLHQFRIGKYITRGNGRIFNIRQLIIPMVLMSLFLLSSCGLLSSGDQSQNIDPPENISFVNEDEIELINDDEQLTGELSFESDSYVKTELYLLDKHGYIVPQTISLPNEEGIAKLSLQSLVKDGPINNFLPSGFQAVLPTDTEVMGINVKDGVATVDFSKEFADYRHEDEEKIMQSITWTLTQFDTIDRVKLQINGHDLTEMPVNGTQIGEGLTRNIGINVDTSNAVDVTNTKPVTVYYLGQDGESHYYVPVTKRVKNTIENNIEAAVEQLVAGPGYNSNLISDFLPEVALIEEPKVEDGKVTLNFNESLISSIDDDNVISEQMLMSLVLSLTEQTGIETVSVLVNGSSELVNKNGDKLTEPVSRPAKVNTHDL